MNKLLTTLALCFVLGACGRKLEGTLVVQKPFQVNLKKGSLPIEKGAYYAKVTSSTFRISGGPNKIKAKIKLPKMDRFKNLWVNDEIYLRGSQIAQPFDIKVELNTETRRGGTTSGTEECIYDTRTSRETVCRDRHGREYCTGFFCNARHEGDYCQSETRTEYVYGERDYEGYTKYQERGGMITLKKGRRILAKMYDKGAQRSDFVTTYTGRCRRY